MCRKPGIEVSLLTSVPATEIGLNETEPITIIERLANTKYNDEDT